MDSSTITLWTGLFSIAGCLGVDRYVRSVASDLGLHCYSYGILGIKWLKEKKLGENSFL